jgi:hypothetical protein
LKDFTKRNNDFIAMLERNKRRLQAMIADVTYSNCRLDKDEPDREHARITDERSAGVYLDLFGRSLPSGFPKSVPQVGSEIGGIMHA